MTTLTWTLTAAAFALAVTLTPASSAGLMADKSLAASPPLAQPAWQAYNARGFRRCMRAKYGPRYFAGVNRAHRWHMAQACMA